MARADPDIYIYSSMSQPIVLHGAGSAPLSERLVKQNSFPQSGTLSWSDLFSKVVTGAVAVLSRFSEGGIDPFTAVVGQLVCQDFKFGRTGTDLFVKILNGLQYHSTKGDVLHFGFGIDSIVRNLSASYEGGILVILSAALAECYFEDHAANILWELVQAYKAANSGDRIPSPTQWLALIRQCDGVLAIDEFPKFAEDLMRLHPQNSLDVGNSSLDLRPRKRGVSSPDSMAEALLAIGKVSTGQLEAITITGTADAGWLAALADRFFNLKLSIYGPEGVLLFTNLDQDERAQITVLYEMASEEGTKKEVEVPGKLFCLRDATEFLHNKHGVYGSALLSGRVPWENALSLTFGSEFSQLIEAPALFGTTIGAAARIFDAVARAEDGVHYDTTRTCTTYLSFGRAQGFVGFAYMRFPELLPLKKQMESASRAPFKEAQGNYESNVSNLKRMCKCKICEMGMDQETYAEGYCLVILTEAIIILLRALSGITGLEDLRPVRAGIEWYYGRQLSVHRQHEMIEQEIARYGQMAFLLDLPFTEGDDFIEESVAVRRLVNATRLFTGRDISENPFERSALSIAGICVFLDILTDISDHPEALGRCTVIPGKIEMAGRSYEVVEDISDFDLQGMDYRQRRGRGQAPDPLFSPSGLIAGYDSASVVAQPAVKCLQVGILAKHPSSGSVLLGPAMLTKGILEASGLIHCKHSAHRSSKKRLSNDSAARQINTDGGHPIWEFHGSLLSQMVAYSRSQDLNYHLIWRHHECQPCCLKAASAQQSTLIIM